jgi:hypothetical protein
VLLLRLKLLAASKQPPRCAPSTSATCPTRWPQAWKS